MNLRHHGCGDPFIIRGVSVHPVGCASVAFDLEGLHQRCRRRLASLHKIFDLSAAHRIAFDGRRVMKVIYPDLTKTVARLDSSRQSAEVVVEERDLCVESPQNLLKRWPSASVFPTILSHANGKGVADLSRRATRR